MVFVIALSAWVGYTVYSVRGKEAVHMSYKVETIKDGTEKIETGIKKIGAMLGDEVEIGCGSILNPGSIIGKNTNIYPLSSVRGVVPKNSIYKKQNEIVEKI